MAGSNIKGGSAFNPRTVLALVLFGAIAFLATLYFIGAGNTGGDDNNGSAHGAGKGLNGYAALAQMLEEQGQEVSLSRSQTSLTEENLLIVTPPMVADGDEMAKIINDRRDIGPTLIILPKWMAFRAQQDLSGEIGKGWVKLGSTSVPEWADELGSGLDLDLSAEVAGTDAEQQWRGAGLTGTLPEVRFSRENGTRLAPLVSNGKDGILAGYLDDGGEYADLRAATGSEADMSSDDDAFYRWPVIFVIEPDLMNNYGLADQQRAQLAAQLVSLSMDGADLPIVFDLTTNGIGNAKNLLTLAFTAPFLAATLCLILAMLVVGWRAFRRFGPPVSDGRSIAFGKARLIKNSAGFIQRSKRLHLLTGPYADMIRERIVRALALKKPDDAFIDKAIAKRATDSVTFSASDRALRNAKSPNDILRAAAALKKIERMLSK
jgi:hypothetical protein